MFLLRIQVEELGQRLKKPDLGSVDMTFAML